MPVDRAAARRNLLNLIQYQLAHESEAGPLHLALWYNIAEQADDLYLFEVFENFAGNDGAPVATYRFPGMGYLWLAGVYYVTACSRTFFEQAVAEADEDVLFFRTQLSQGRAELLSPERATDSRLAMLLLA
jgi:hypothetical protein